jgi:dipeptidyl aminopeptidase/acylaminoacyl peptidase
MKHLAAALLLSFVALTAAAQTGSPAAASSQPPARQPIPATPGATFDLAWIGKIVRLTDPQISPSGKSVALVATRPDYEHDLNLAEIYLVDTSTGATRPLTHNRKSAASPRWSPSGATLAFLAADAEKHNQVFLLDMAGGDALQLTQSPTSIQQFAWKPDGSAIAYAAPDDAPKKTGADSFDDAFEVGDNDFLVKSKALPTHLWLISIPGPNNETQPAKRLTSGSWSIPVPFPPEGPPSPISFTPDGSKLLYVRIENTYSGDRNHRSPWILDLAGGQSWPVTSHTKNAAYSLVSPDGARIAYSLPRDGIDRNYTDIYVTSSVPSASKPDDGVNLTSSIDHDFQPALWTPDSKAILTAADDGVTIGLWLQSLSGNTTRLNVGNVTPAGFNIGPQGQVAFTGAQPHHPVELYLIDSPSQVNAPPRRLTHFNDAFDSLALGTTEVLTWQSPDTTAPGSKSFAVDGLLTYPPHYTPGKKLPLVLYIHGGPSGNSVNAFSIFPQIIAAQGWLVFEPNYRGSDNEGNDFSRAIIDDSGDGPGRDVLAGIQALKQRGIVDDSNIAVTGWSYGGYMTTWLIGHANFWKAAIAGAPVTNLLDQYNLTDTDVMRAAAIGGSPYTGDWMKHWIEQSPITYASNMVTPTLILQDTGDYRVTITNGYELYHALKDRGIPTQFYAYPVGGHSPADPVRIRDVYRRWIEWLDLYLPHD